jgi:two-component system OmpR family response regulator
MRILVVDDDRRLALAVKRGLTEEGFAVDIAGDGDEALWYAAENPYDCIVLDLMLPGADGLDVCAQLRARGDWTPILMLTAKVGERDEASSLDSGADDFLSKPFSFVVLVARLRAIARRGERPRAATMTAGDLRLDPATRTCTRSDTPIALTTREFALLEALMRRSGDVVSKQQLLEEVWGPTFAGDPNIVEVYVGYLRKKVDAPFATHTILTVRGAGYRTVADA